MSWCSLHWQAEREQGGGGGAARGKVLARPGGKGKGAAVRKWSGAQEGDLRAIRLLTALHPGPVPDPSTFLEDGNGGSAPVSLTAGMKSITSSALASSGSRMRR